MIPLRKLWPVIRLNRSWRLYLSTSIPENASESSISDVYERKTPVEHVLLRPGMYIGDIDNKSVETWMYDLTNNHMQRELVNYSPALLKIFDEILVNAADNVHRSGKKMTKIEVDILITSGGGLQISVLNDGKGIPVEKHTKENIYVPELIFGHLLTGSNFNDDSKRLTGGRHGYGAKLTNIFSKKFSIKILDSAKKLLYHQSWANNMSSASDPKITKTKISKSSSDYTRVTFEPDLPKFALVTSSSGNTQALNEIMRLFHRRTIDIAACVPSVKVTFNGQEIAVKSFKDYVRLFTTPLSASTTSDALGNTDIDKNDVSSIETDSVAADSIIKTALFYQKVNDRWEVGVMRSHNNTFENMSFVNSVWTPDGGTHVQLVFLQIVRAFEEALHKKGVTNVHINTIRNRLMIFVKCSIENPAFESQSKLSLSSKPSSFGSQCILPPSFLKQIVVKSGILDEILLDLKFREESKLMKSVIKSKRASSGSLVDVPKLEDALFAGDSKKALDCTLILTEGDSAKALAIAGLEAVGRQYYGVMPLRGKILNVRVASTAQLMKNEELVNLCKAVGLDFNQTYDSDSLNGLGLRYGKVLLMCDQDQDGSHIKGLVINFFHHFWPALLKHQGFLQQFITPLVKVTSTASNGIKSFYSMQEYNAWRKSIFPLISSTNSHSSHDQTANSTLQPPVSSASASVDMKKYKIKYYKGLGTNTAEEGKEYFRSLDSHVKEFTSSTQDDDSIDLAFSKSRAADRRQWLESYYDADEFIDPKTRMISYTDFVNKELVQFSFSDNTRSIPSVVDGLKPSQRKILYACFKKKLTSDMKVVQLAGYVAEHTAYHHGEVSLHAAIVNMAQDFVGSNNVPLLVPSGQFGTRYQGGSDFASPRYIFTRLAPVTRLLFPEADDSHLTHLEEDGAVVEPKSFLPIIPLLLVNGCQGIGTGWSTFVPGYNPLDILEYVKQKVRQLGSGIEKDTTASVLPTLQPWVCGFKGTIIPSSYKENDFESHGLVVVKGRGNKVVLEVEELPCGNWTDDYKRHLCQLVEKDEIKSFSEEHTTRHVHFTIIPTAQYIDSPEQLIEKLKLKSNISLQNMVAFDANGALKRYQSPEQIIDDFFPVRLRGYDSRKQALMKRLVRDEAIARNKSQFVAQIISGQLDIFQFTASSKQPVTASTTTNKDNNKTAATTTGKTTPRGLSEVEIASKLIQAGFLSQSQIDSLSENNQNKQNESVISMNFKDTKVIEGEREKPDFSYLLDMSIHSLTETKFESLRQQADTAAMRLKELQNQSAADLWLRDLDALEVALKSIVT